MGIYTIKLVLLSFLIGQAFQTNEWKPGKTDSNGNLIIVEMENNPQMKDRPLHETVTVDTKWSILIMYDEDSDPGYYIFNNQTKRIFSTGSFTEFSDELIKIPNNTTISKIGRCTMPFDYMMPEKEKEQIERLLREKNCNLEEHIMYCWCGAVKIVYPFENL